MLLQIRNDGLLTSAKNGESLLKILSVAEPLRRQRVEIELNRQTLDAVDLAFFADKGRVVVPYISVEKNGEVKDLPSLSVSESFAELEEVSGVAFGGRITKKEIIVENGIGYIEETVINLKGDDRAFSLLAQRGRQKAQERGISADKVGAYILAAPLSEVMALSLNAAEMKFEKAKVSVDDFARSFVNNPDREGHFVVELIKDGLLTGSYLGRNPLLHPELLEESYRQHGGKGIGIYSLTEGLIYDFEGKEAEKLIGYAQSYALMKVLRRTGVVELCSIKEFPYDLSNLRTEAHRQLVGNHLKANCILVGNALVEVESANRKAKLYPLTEEERELVLELMSEGPAKGAVRKMEL